MKSEEAAYAATLFEFRDKELAELHQAIKDGRVTLSQLTDPSGGIFRFAGALRSRLIHNLAEVRNFGIQQVSDELARQKPPGAA